MGKAHALFATATVNPTLINPATGLVLVAGFFRGLSPQSRLVGADRPQPRFPHTLELSMSTTYATPIYRIALIREGKVLSRPAFTSSAIAKKFCKRMFDERSSDREVMAVIHLDTKFRPISIEFVTTGTIDASLAHPREIFKGAIHAGASAIMLAHNHPSGDPTPSKEDISVTKKMDQVAEIVGIPVLDHIVVGEDECVSIRESMC